MASIGSTDLVNALGSGAGFDTKKIVTTLVAAEKASSQASIDRKSEDVEAKVSGTAQLKSAIQTLKTAFEVVDDKRDFNFSSLSNSNPEQLYADFDTSTSVPGTYKINVSQLAQNDSIRSSAVSSQTADQNGTSAATVVIKIGTGTATTLTLGAGATSLDDLVTGINNLDIDVTARVVEVSTGSYRVVVEGPQGADNALTITDSVFGITTDTSAATYSSSSKTQAAQNSTITVNGLSVSRSSNEVDDLVPGLKLDLMAVTSSDLVLSVSRNSSIAKNAITNLVAAYNAFDAVMQDLTGAETSTGETGLLKSDSAVKGILDTVRDFLTSNSSTPGTNITSMSDMGITIQRDGKFKIDSTKFGTAMTSYYDDITKLFSGDSDDQSSYSADARGMAGDIVTKIDDYLSWDGLITLREAAYKTSQTSITKSQEVLDAKMVKVEDRYTKQFSTMSKIMDEMNAMQDYLEQQLSNLPYNNKD
jgi:flagellar hook-associated protein 2